jgi:chemotaxis protein CheC
MISREEFDDALAELVNVGVGRAAASLSAMVRERIELSVPKILTITYKDLGYHLGLEQGFEGDESLSIVQQGFGGKIGGAASILFPLSSARKLVSMLTDGALSSEELDLEREAALTEVGNILINGVMGSIGNMTGMEISFYLPEYLECSSEDLEKNYENRDILLAVVLISISGQEIKGHLVLLFDLPSMENHTAVIERMSQGPS